MLNHLIEISSTFTIAFVNQFGLWGIFMGMLLEGACLPIPSEIVMPIGGFFVEKAMFPLWQVVGVGVLGNLIGSIIIYWIGLRVARSILVKYGKYFLLSQKHIEKSEAWFAKNGEWASFFGRNLPFVRSIISLPAGISEMKFTKFCLYTGLGCIPWNLALAYLGYALGANWKAVETYVRPISYGVAVILFFAALYLIYNLIRSKDKKQGMI
jgi:membrane protein DedA with SNARE-associated domain